MPTNLPAKNSHPISTKKALQKTAKEEGGCILCIVFDKTFTKQPYQKHSREYNHLPLLRPLFILPLQSNNNPSKRLFPLTMGNNIPVTL